MSKMWFGTEGHMEWIDTPASGADASAQSWGASGTLLGGGGYVMHSFGAHKTYQFSWGEAAAKRAASKMEAYRRGSYGRGLIYFHDPLILDTNVLPAHWADPSAAVDGEAPSLAPGLLPVGVKTRPNTVDLPVQTARYTIPTDYAFGYPGAGRSLYIPTPPGFNLRICAWYDSTQAHAGLYATYFDEHGKPAGNQKLNSTPSYADSTFMLINGSTHGVRLWLGRNGDLTRDATVNIAGIVARLVPIPADVPSNPARGGDWVPGDGHSGCRFDGVPTRVSLSGVNGGQVGYAASFREVGAWE